MSNAEYGVDMTDVLELLLFWMHYSKNMTWEDWSIPKTI